MKSGDLLAEYETATRLYSLAVSELSRQRGTLPYDAYVKLRMVAEDAHEEYERARVELRDFFRPATQD